MQKQHDYRSWYYYKTPADSVKRKAAKCYLFVHKYSTIQDPNTGRMYKMEYLIKVVSRWYDISRAYADQLIRLGGELNERGELTALVQPDDPAIPRL